MQQKDKSMRKIFVYTLCLLTLFLLSPATGLAQTANAPSHTGHIMIPRSSIAQPDDAGVNAHTNIRMWVPENGQFGRAAQPQELPPFAGFFFETPASIACVYHLVNENAPPFDHSCNPNVTTQNPTGGGGAIALVEAFDDQTAAADLATFSAQFGLPAANLTIVFANGTQPTMTSPGPDPSGGSELETSLDIEWAHAMAPNAKIFLVEAKNLGLGNLFNAAILASRLVAANGGGEVSMSFGTGEFTQETEFDVDFTTPGVVYFASAGDSPGVIYPSASPNVISAGGTTLSRNSTTGAFELENTWQDAGGGPSQVEPRPAFQNIVRSVVGNFRGTPDLSFDSNPNTGVWVFDSNPVFGTGWFVVGGTSVAAPALAGIVNAAGRFRTSSQAENTEIYNNVFDPAAFNDIQFGTCGLNIGSFAVFGWDFCTGVGSDRGYFGK
jgi:kumamolisin